MSSSMRSICGMSFTIRGVGCISWLERVKSLSSKSSRAPWSIRLAVEMLMSSRDAARESDCVR